MSSCLSSFARGSVSLDWTKPLSEEKSDTFLQVMEQLEHSYSNVQCQSGRSARNTPQRAPLKSLSASPCFSRSLSPPYLAPAELSPRHEGTRQRVGHCAEPCPVRPGNFSQQQRPARGSDQPTDKTGRGSLRAEHLSPGRGRTPEVLPPGASGQPVASLYRRPS